MASSAHLNTHVQFTLKRGWRALEAHVAELKLGIGPPIDTTITRGCSQLIAQKALHPRRHAINAHRHKLSALAIFLRKKRIGDASAVPTLYALDARTLCSLCSS